MTLLKGGEDVAEAGQGLLALAVALVTVVLQRTLKQAALVGWDPALVAVWRQVGKEPDGGKRGDEV